MTERVSVAIFAKAPIPGFAKTRLIPTLGADGAALLQSQLIGRTVGVARAAGLGSISLWCTPDSNHACFAAVAAKGDVQLHVQAQGDLGVRMRAAFEILLASGPALLMGTDCLVITAEHLHQCARHLHRDADAVFLPVEDGGYILVGLNRPAPHLFQDIPWNGAAVMRTTRARAADIGLRIAEPAMLWDIDHPQEYARAQRENLLAPSDPRTAGR